MSPRLNRDGAAYRELLQLGDEPTSPGPDPYRVLHYPGDITGELLPGQILGADVFGRPFEVLDAEVEHREAPGHFDGDGCTFPTPGHLVARTRVHLQYATPESITRAVDELRALVGAR